MSNLIKETCGCGATLHYSGPTPSTVAREWRSDHNCTLVAPGPCLADPHVKGPDGQPFLCDLRAGHVGGHECDRGQWGGTAYWPREEQA